MIFLPQEQGFCTFLCLRCVEFAHSKNSSGSGRGGGEWSGIELTDVLGSYIGKSLRFLHYASLSTCCQNLEKKFGSLEKFGENGGVSFKGSDPEKCQF